MLTNEEINFLNDLLIVHVRDRADEEKARAILERCRLEGKAKDKTVAKAAKTFKKTKNSKK